MEILLLFILSGAIGWGLAALLLLAFVHALTRAMATRMGVPHGRTVVGAPPIDLAVWASHEEGSTRSPAGELLQAGRTSGESGPGGRREQEAPAA